MGYRDQNAPKIYPPPVLMRWLAACRIKQLDLFTLTRRTIEKSLAVALNCSNSLCFICRFPTHRFFANLCILGISQDRLLLARADRITNSIPINAATSQESPRPKIKLTVDFDVDIF